MFSCLATLMETIILKSLFLFMRHWLIQQCKHWAPLCLQVTLSFNIDQFCHRYLQSKIIILGLFYSKNYQFWTQSSSLSHGFAALHETPAIQLVDKNHKYLNLNFLCKNVLELIKFNACSLIWLVFNQIYCQAQGQGQGQTQSQTSNVKTM